MRTKSAAAATTMSTITTTTIMRMRSAAAATTMSITIITIMRRESAAAAMTMSTITTTIMRTGSAAAATITGFANSVAAPAIEYKKEGQVFGIGCKIFTIAGPVILYGIFTSWGLETSRSVSLERLNEILHDLAHTEKYGTVLRAKGMLPDENGVWHYFDMVPEETEVREGAPIYTGKVCVIGSGLKEDDLKELFH